MNIIIKLNSFFLFSVHFSSYSLPTIKEIAWIYLYDWQELTKEQTFSRTAQSCVGNPVACKMLSLSKHNTLYIKYIFSDSPIRCSDIATINVMNKMRCFNFRNDICNWSQAQVKNL